MNSSVADIAQRPSRTAIIALLEGANLPTVDLTDGHLEHFFFLGARTAPFGLVGLEIHGRDALLRSLVVASDFRAAGAGSALVEHAEGYARTRSVDAIYLLTTTAEPFFAHRGYGRIEHGEAPASIRSTREYSDICPTSSALMVKHL
ncbi:MAG: arsenic resistance N-acetyltransferase ArsN2 [Steroidobacteraceae bacterium]